VPPEIAGTEIPAPPPDMPQTQAPAGVQFDTPVPPPSPGEPRQITSMPGLPGDATPPSSPSPPQVAAIPPAVPPGDLPTGTEFRVVFPDSASESLSPKDTALLNGVAARLRQNDTVRLQVMGYASGTPETNRDARRLSLERALAVRGYLVDRGIRPTRIDVRALGFQVPDGPTDRVDLLLVN
jgi:outer membrane protein OmpA-like peptidoglycan-associated protein